MTEWRAVGGEGRFPPWLRALRGKSGVYAIRLNGWFSTTVAYVGESHTDNLYKTLTRHFQRWGRGKKFWRGAYAPAQTDPGHTYPRSSVEVAVQTSTRGKALQLQDAWIRRLNPRDNAAAPTEDAPF